MGASAVRKHVIAGSIPTLAFLIFVCFAVSTADSGAQSSSALYGILAKVIGTGNFENYLVHINVDTAEFSQGPYVGHTWQSLFSGSAIDSQRDLFYWPYPQYTSSPTTDLYVVGFGNTQKRQARSFSYENTTLSLQVNRKTGELYAITSNQDSKNHQAQLLKVEVEKGNVTVLTTLPSDFNPGLSFSAGAFDSERNLYYLIYQGTPYLDILNFKHNLDGQYRALDVFKREFRDYLFGKQQKKSNSGQASNPVLGIINVVTNQFTSVEIKCNQRIEDIEYDYLNDKLYLVQRDQTSYYGNVLISSLDAQTGECEVVVPSVTGTDTWSNGFAFSALKQEVAFVLPTVLFQVSLTDQKVKNITVPYQPFGYLGVIQYDE